MKFSFFKKKREVIPRGSGVLILIFGESTDIYREGEEDRNTFIQFSINTKLVFCQTVKQVRDAIRCNKPEIFYLISKFDLNGRLTDSEGNLLSVSEVMKLSESSGVRVFFSASENKFESIKDEIIESDVMDFMTVLQRNKHYSTFLKGLIGEMMKGRNFAMSYVNLAPQHEMAQRGLPLPGTIAICPVKNGERIVLWTNAQE